MVAGAAISGALSDAEWLKALRDLGKADGYFSTLGREHAALFVEQSHHVLFVGFETMLGIRATSERGLPVAYDVCEARGWSHLTLLATRQEWYRDRAVWTYFDRLVDYDFFEDFDRVIFYGAGMCGYAAAAFSVAAPGATVLAISPQATLDRRLTQWDDRFPSVRRTDFATRYAYAPDMIEAADKVHLIYDPDEIEDAMHASLFRGDNVNLHRYRRGGAGAIEGDLRSMGLISALSESAANGTLTPARLAHELRTRKRHVPYLRALLSRTLGEDRPWLVEKLCRSVVSDMPLPRFQQHLEIAERELKSKAAAHAPSEDSAEGTV